MAILQTGSVGLIIWIRHALSILNLKLIYHWHPTNQYNHQKLTLFKTHSEGFSPSMATGKWRIDRTTSAMLRRILLVNIDHVVLRNTIMAALIKHVMSKNSPNKLFSKQLCVVSK